MGKILEVQQYDFQAFNEKLKPQVDENGFLTLSATAAVVGVMEYRDNNGRVIKQLVPHETLSDTESFRTLEDKPVTYNHPKSLLTAKDAKKWACGHVKAGVFFDGDELIAPMIITDEKLQNVIKEGKAVEVSPGYIATLEEAKPGATFNGEAYDYIQRGRRYNHLAVVEVARGGRRAKLHLDNNEDNCGTIGFMDSSFTNKETNMSKVSVQLDDSTIELEEGTASHIMRYKDKVAAQLDEKDMCMEDMNKKYADMEKKFKEMQGKADGYKAEMDKMKKDMEDMKKDKQTDAAQLDAMIEERSGIIDVAAKVIENFDAKGLSNKDIIRKVLENQYTKDGKCERDFSDKDDVYCRAFFDAIADNVKDALVAKQAKAISNVKQADSGVETAEQLRRRLMREQQDAC